MRLIGYLLALGTSLGLLLGCSGKPSETSGEQVAPQSTIYSIIGKHVRIEYPEMKAEITYSSDSTLHWKTINQQNVVAEGDEKMSIKQVGDSLFFINWIEQDGETVSQVVDLKKQIVTVFLSYHDPNSDRGQRTGIPFEGKLTFSD